jgi:hypothetical protein
MLCFELETPMNPATLRMALQAPIRYNNEMPSGLPFDVIWDSGASITVSPNRSDFVGRYEKPPMMIKLSGLVRGLNIKGQGHVMWAACNTEGLLATSHKSPCLPCTRMQDPSLKHFFIATNLHWRTNHP